MADLVVPQLGESITEAVIAKWRKNVGDAVAANDIVVDLETDKVTVELPAPVAGALTEQRFPVGATVKVGDIVGAIDQSAKGATAPAAAPAEKPAPSPSKSAAPANGAAAQVQVAPSRAGTEKGPPPPPPQAQPAPTKGDGGLDKEALLDLPPSQRRLARERGELPAAGGAPAPAAAKPAQPSGPIDPRDEVVPMTTLRKRIAERLVQAQHESASLTTFNEVDMTAVMELRAKYKDTFEKQHGVKLGFMSFFVKACVAAAKAWPGVNAEIRGDSIIYKKHYDFGIAVSTPRGLVVPVLRDCDKRSFAEIEKGIVELAEKARNGKLAIDDLLGGTFSITNGGIYGSMMSTPLLNYPQTGILGMHNIVKRAVVVDDAVVAKPMMYVALSYDHRVVDGREAVSFLVAVKERLEAPDRMLLEH
jgi:2-oxoglutarate dehydrogenase E2 component (dihydrolipoamide succinyltransferase)